MPPGHRSAGFALIIVLWTLVLIAFITAQVVGSARSEIRIADNLVANAVTAAAADGGVSRAIFALLNTNPATRWPLDGKMRAFTIGDCRMTVQVFDETARINPNLAAPALLETLLRVTGSDPGQARRLAIAIAEWIGGQGAARSAAALAAQYRDAGRNYAPPGEPLQTIGELRRVIGVTPAVFAAIRPHLSLFAPAEPDPTHADPAVRAAMTALARSRPATAALAAPRSDILTARIAAIAEGPDNARARRTAIVQIAPKAGSYTVLAWNDASD